MSGNLRRIFVLVLSMLFVMSVFAVAATLDLRREHALQKERDTRVLMALKSQVEKSLVNRLRLTDGMVAFILNERTLDANVVDPYMDRLLPKGDPVIRNVAIMQGTTIGYQYPLAGNEASIGVDLLTIPEQRAAVLEAMTTLSNTINGPIELVQGGKGLVMRIPLSTISGDPQGFWGLISLVLDYDALVAEIEGQDFLEGYDFLIQKLDAFGNPGVLVYASGMLKVEGVTTAVNVMSEQWQIQVAPQQVAQLPLIFYGFIVLGVLISLIVGWLLNKWLLQRASLNEEVEERTRQLRDTNEILEQYVAEFEEKQAELELVNGQLEDSLEDLRQTQAQLVVTEKLAALGDLVASLAHEINTPLGVCVTLYSFVEENLDQFKRKYLVDKLPLDRQHLEQFLEDNREALMLMGHNLKRSSELVSSFKLVSMDQYLEEYRIVNLAEYIDEIVNSIRPKYKRIDTMLTLEIDPEIRMYTYPGAISQILTNLINNSIIHGFEGRQEGHIRLSIAAQDADWVVFKYCDTGVGLTEEVRDKIFQPFFTTKRHKGSSGLGMHIVYNAVVNTLGGEMVLMEQVDGFGVVIKLPVKVERDV